MTRYLLDTNIISNIVKPKPSESLLAWMGEQRDEDLFIASLTIAEIRRGILEKPRGKKRDSLDAWFAGPEGPQALFADRILSFDDKAGLLWARLMVEGKLAGRPRSGLDMIIAAVAGANDCVVVTDNEKDFVGLQIINPLRRGLEGGNRTMTAAPPLVGSIPEPRAFQAAIAAEFEAARPLSHNAFKVELAIRTGAAVLAELMSISTSSQTRLCGLQGSP